MGEETEKTRELVDAVIEEERRRLLGEKWRVEAELEALERVRKLLHEKVEAEKLPEEEIAEEAVEEAKAEESMEKVGE